MNSTIDESLGVIFDDVPGSSTLLEKFRGRLKGRGSWTHEAVLKRVSRIQQSGPPRFLLRVDDYPRWDKGLEGFSRFHSILRQAGIPYLLGVIPRPADDPGNEEGHIDRVWTSEEKDVLKDAAKHAEIALHGWTHRRRRRDVEAEIVERSREELNSEIEEGLYALQSLGLMAKAYIPPFNAVDANALDILKEHFSVVFGGPESVRWLGRLGSPCMYRGALFVPSYPPAYGLAWEAARFVTALRRWQVPILVTVTLHWAWEERAGFEGLRRLAGALDGAAVTLTSWLDGRAWS
jgi:peptidoglycan/xylan/chitin deacetylase (PgdA/CDA1 family)